MFINNVLFVLILSAGLLQAEKAVLSYDLTEKQGHVRNFRKCDSILASGSSQFSEQGLKYIMESIPNKKIVCVDLRQEPHGFKESSPISWRRGLNWVYAGKLTEQIELHQKKRLAKLSARKKIKLTKDKRSIKTISAQTKSENELCGQFDVSYLRIPVEDHHHPSDYEVQRFISFIQQLPEGVWLHFHCFAGIGRTSLFMIMYDAIKNAKLQTLQEIVERQVQLGSLNLLYEPENLSAWPKNEHARKAFLIKFYEYCKTNTDNFKTPFVS